MRERGFTLVEMIVAISLIGVLAVMAAPLLRLPMTAWMDSSRRADLGSSADLVQNKLAADLARAMPNSVRVRNTGGRFWLEYLERRATGRHSAVETVCPGTCLTTLGPLVGDTPVLPGDWIVVHPRDPAVQPGGDPYAGGNGAIANGVKVRLTGSAAVAGGTRLQHASHSFPAQAPSRRFHVVSTPVTIDCNPATGLLQRHSGYAISAAQPVAFAGAQSVPLARNVQACSLRYTQAGAQGGGGVVSVWLRLAAAAADTGAPEGIEIVLQHAVSELP